MKNYDTENSSPKPNKYRRKLNGYRPTHKNRWLFVQSGLLSLQALCLYEFYIDISDFDKKHSTYGTFTVKFSQICLLFACSEGTIRNWHNELLKAELIIKGDESGQYQIVSPDRYLLPGKWGGKAQEFAAKEKDQPAVKILHLVKVGLQVVVEKVQPDEEIVSPNIERTPSIGIGSFKDKSKDTKKEILSEDDKRWLNETVRIVEELS